MWAPRAARVVADLITGLPPERRTGLHAARLNALHICGSMWADYYLRATGEVVVVGEDEDHPDVDTVYTERTKVLAALVAGARRYPELAQLIPPRPPEAVNCVCVRLPKLFGPGKVVCPTCGGVGWLPPTD